MMHPKFVLDEQEQRRLAEWLATHNRNCRFAKPENQGAIGGRFTYCFTPTALGVATVVKCACGSEVNVTNYSQW